MQLLTKTLHEVMNACQERNVSSAYIWQRLRQGRADAVSIFTESHGAETARILTSAAQFH